LDKKSYNWLKWLWPGMRVKRWLLITLLGIALTVSGLILFTNLQGLDYIDILNNIAEAALDRFGVNITHSSVNIPLGVTLILLGGIAIIFSFIQMIRSIVGALMPEDAMKTGDLAERIYQRRTLAQGLRIVVVGGGTGLSTMLRGLKQYSSNITAIVTVSDNGGSSGELTKSTGILPPGDLRNCMVAMGDDEQTLARAFNFRFNGQHAEGLRGHSLGNLFIAALVEINKGNYEDAIQDASKILAIRGQVFPSTLDTVTLVAEMVNGDWVEGETQIVDSKIGIGRLHIRPENAQPHDNALKALADADVIVLGPGSVYTSIIPNLLVNGIPQAIAESNAVKLYVCNVMTERGETDDFTASDHVAALEAHSSGYRIFDYVLVNKQRPAADILEKYEQYGQAFVEPDLDKIREMGYTPILGNFVSQTKVVRHDEKQLAKAISEQVF
jgi:uncharacterized cofD-like protein